ncbi:MAG: helix-turn-helix domain-containing protein [Actinobacteria bacterium]|nr:helix-turn-helix domain-containing protein [Actinomycetota bacterium]
MEQVYLTVPEAAQYLNTTVRFVRRLIEERRIAFHRIGRHVRLARTDLDVFIAASRVEPNAQSMSTRRAA